MFIKKHKVPEWITFHNSDSDVPAFCVRTSTIHSIDGNKVYHIHGTFDVIETQQLEALKKLLGIDT